MKLECDVYDLATAILLKTQEAADVMLQMLVDSILGEQDGIELAEAYKLVRANLGYYAGYYDDETRRRVERLYRCVHPIFGAIEQNGPPTPEEAFQAGINMGSNGVYVKYEQPVDEPPKPPKIRAIEV